MTNPFRRALVRLSLLLLVFGLACGLCDLVTSLNAPKPTSRQISPVDVARTLSVACNGRKDVSVHLNPDGSLVIEAPPAETITGTWTIDKQAQINFYYKTPVVKEIGPGWYVADAKDGTLMIVQTVDPEACYWLDPNP